MPTKCVFSYLSFSAPHVVTPLQANCERILNHRNDLDQPEFFFQSGFADAVQELWADDIIPVLFDTPTYFPFADNAA